MIGGILCRALAKRDLCVYGELVDYSRRAREACVVHSSRYRRISQGLFWFRICSLQSEGLVNGMSPSAHCFSW